MATGNVERILRAARLAFFLLTMVASLLLMSAPVLVAVGDVVVSLVLASRFACARCYGLREHVGRYCFRSSLMDVPLVSVVRSLLITCVYCLCDRPVLRNNLFLGTTTLCSFVSILILFVKVCVFTPNLGIDYETMSTLARQKQHLKESWGMAALFISSLVFAFIHVVVAYRTSFRAQRKLLFNRVDHETVLACKNVFSGYNKVTRSPTPCMGQNSEGKIGTRGNLTFHGDNDLPINLLIDMDSLFIACQGMNLHYKLSGQESYFSAQLASAELRCGSSSPCFSPRKPKSEKPISCTPKNQYRIERSLSSQLHVSSLYAPLLDDTLIPTAYCPRQVPALGPDNDSCDLCLPSGMIMGPDVEENGSFGVVLIHGFGGGVFSWRHVMDILARQIGCTVVAFDRPGWGLTTRLQRKDWEEKKLPNPYKLESQPGTSNWEEKKLPNPYKLESQVDLLLFFCSRLGFSSVVLVGHDDGGLLALKAAEKVRASSDFINVSIKGVVLLSVSLSREVVPAFARILLHTSLGKKRMVRPLLRAEITQVINRNAWHDATKLTSEILNLYKAPLCVEGWEEAVHEIGRFSFATVLSPQNAAALLKSVDDLPVMVVTGAEDALVSLRSAQAMSSELLNSRLVAISGCGHLPHEECPKALIAALSPFITGLLSSPNTLQK